MKIYSTKKSEVEAATEVVNLLLTNIEEKLNTSHHSSPQLSLKPFYSFRYCTYHVVPGGDELHRAPGELRALVPVPTVAVVVQVREVGGGHVVLHAADIAAPAPAVVCPGHVGVDVGAAAFAAHDARRAEVHHLDLCAIVWSRYFKQKQKYTAQDNERVKCKKLRAKIMQTKTFLFNR